MILVPRVTGSERRVETIPPLDGGHRRLGGRSYPPTFRGEEWPRTAPRLGAGGNSVGDGVGPVLQVTIACPDLDRRVYYMQDAHHLCMCVYDKSNLFGIAHSLLCLSTRC